MGEGEGHGRGGAGQIQQRCHAPHLRGGPGQQIAVRGGEVGPEAQALTSAGEGGIGYLEVARGGIEAGDGEVGCLADAQRGDTAVEGGAPGVGIGPDVANQHAGVGTERGEAEQQQECEEEPATAARVADPSHRAILPIATPTVSIIIGDMGRTPPIA